MKSVNINKQILLTDKILNACEEYFKTQKWAHDLKEDERKLGVKLQHIFLSILNDLFSEDNFQIFSEELEKDRGKGDFINKHGEFIDVKIGINSKNNACTLTQYSQNTIQFKNQKNVSAFLCCYYETETKILTIMGLISKEDLYQVRGGLEGFKKDKQEGYYLISEHNINCLFKNEYNQKVFPPINHDLQQIAKKILSEKAELFEILKNA